MRNYSFKRFLPPNWLEQMKDSQIQEIPKNSTYTVFIRLTALGAYLRLGAYQIFTILSKCSSIFYNKTVNGTNRK